MILPEAVEQILSREEEPMPSLPVQSQSEEQQPPRVETESYQECVSTKIPESEFVKLRILG